MADLTPLEGERQSRESNNAVIACNDYLRMGAGRSLASLAEKYGELQRNTVPTHSLNTLSRWSTDFNWQDRAAAYDAGWEERKNEERERVLNEGLSLDYERVRKLIDLAELLENEIYTKDTFGVYCNIWVPDVKVVGSGDNATTVDIERFNAGILREYRDTLADIAAEVGGRVKKQEITGAEGEDLRIRFVWQRPDEDD